MSDRNETNDLKWEVLESLKYAFPDMEPGFLAKELDLQWNRLLDIYNQYACSATFLAMLAATKISQ